jgi:hypothetical protein
MGASFAGSRPAFSSAANNSLAYFCVISGPTACQFSPLSVL